MFYKRWRWLVGTCRVIGAFFGQEALDKTGFAVSLARKLVRLWCLPILLSFKLENCIMQGHVFGSLALMLVCQKWPY